MLRSNKLKEIKWHRCFHLIYFNRDLIKKLLVHDRTRRLGSMKVSKSNLIFSLKSLVTFCYAGHENSPIHHQWEIVVIVKAILLTNAVRNVLQILRIFHNSTN